MNNNNFDPTEDGTSVEEIRENILHFIDSDPTAIPHVFGNPFEKQFFDQCHNLIPPRTARIPDGLPTGFRDFDLVVGGLRKGEFSTVAALASSGASSLILNVVRRIIARSATTDEQENSRNQKIGNIVVFTTDTTEAQFLHRLLCAQAKVNPHVARTGHIFEQERIALRQARDRLSNGKLTINDTYNFSVDDVRRACETKAAAGALDLIVIDKVNGVGIDFDGRCAPLEEILEDLKQVAVDMNVPVLGTFGVPTEKADPQTGRIEIYETPAALRFYPDVQMVLHRADHWRLRAHYDNHPDEIPERVKTLEVLELEVARQRGGPSDSVRFAFNERLGRLDTVLWD